MSKQEKLERVAMMFASAMLTGTACGDAFPDPDYPMGGTGSETFAEATARVAFVFARAFVDEANTWKDGDPYE